MKKKLLVGAMVALLALPTLTGCYINKQVEQHQIGVQMDDGVSITAIVGAGRYTKWPRWFADLQIVDVSAKTITWQDPDAVTKDKQPVGFDLSVTYRRMRDSESVKGMWTNYHAEATSDAALEALVRTRIPLAAKAASTQFTLDEMLADRNSIQGKVEEVLAPELADCYIELLYVGVSNIAPSPMYVDKLEEKAAAQIGVEVAQELTKQKEEELHQEEAQTKIDLEKAKRQGKINEVLAEVYKVSPEIYELRRLELIAEMFDDNDKVWIIPESSSLNLIFGGDDDVPAVIAPPVAPGPEPTE